MTAMPMALLVRLLSRNLGGECRDPDEEPPDGDDGEANAIVPPTSSPAWSNPATMSNPATRLAARPDHDRGRKGRLPPDRGRSNQLTTPRLLFGTSVSGDEKHAHDANEHREGRPDPPHDKAAEGR